MNFTGMGWLPWKPALAIALVLLLVSLVLRRRDRTKSAASLVGQAALIAVLYAIWQFAASLANGELAAATDAGLWVAHVQDVMGFPSEASWQQMVLGVDWLTRAADSYYVVAHVPVFIATLVWVLVFHRRDWPFARTVTIVLTGLCLLIQYWPVAPPRLIPSLGVISTADLHGNSVYDAIPGANQFSAMPSIHVGWAAAVALIVIVVARTRWRWLVLAYPLVTMWVVVITGNHFFLDGVAAVLLLGVAVGVALAIPSQRPTRMLDREIRSRAALPEAASEEVVTTDR